MTVTLLKYSCGFMIVTSYFLRLLYYCIVRCSVGVRFLGGPLWEVPLYSYIAYHVIIYTTNHQFLRNNASVHPAIMEVSMMNIILSLNVRNCSTSGNASMKQQGNKIHNSTTYLTEIKCVIYLKLATHLQLEK